MNANQQMLQLFVQREIAPWLESRTPGAWVTSETAQRFRAFIEQETVSYLEQRLLTAAVASVLGVDNPATPFVVDGLKLVLDEETPAAIRFAHDHQQQIAIAGAIAVVCLVLWALDD